MYRDQIARRISRSLRLCASRSAVYATSMTNALLALATFVLIEPGSHISGRGEVEQRLAKVFQMLHIERSDTCLHSRVERSNTTHKQPHDKIRFAALEPYLQSFLNSYLQPFLNSFFFPARCQLHHTLLLAWRDCLKLGLKGVH